MKIDSKKGILKFQNKFTLRLKKVSWAALLTTNKPLTDRKHNSEVKASVIFETITAASLLVPARKINLLSVSSWFNIKMTSTVSLVILYVCFFIYD